VSTQECVGTDADGNDLLVGPVRSALYVKPTLDVEGSVTAADMDLRWRQHVCTFLWRKAPSLCHKLSYATLHVNDPFGGDMPGEVLDELVSSDIAFLDMTRDEDARRAWFEARPLVAKLRTSVCEERDARLSRPVLLG
jgi:hypothetical protein